MLNYLFFRNIWESLRKWSEWLETDTLKLSEVSPILVTCSNSIPWDWWLDFIQFGNGTKPDTSQTSKGRYPTTANLQILFLKPQHSQECIFCQKNLNNFPWCSLENTRN